MKNLLVASLVLTLVLFGATPLVLAQAGPLAINISTPANGEVVSATSVNVSGSASGLPENNSLLVQALDGNGNVLAEQTATTDASTPCGMGNWSVTLAIAVEPGSVGLINAMSGPALATVNVVFGEAAPEPEPTQPPAPEPTAVPTEEPTTAPTVAPTLAPTVIPTAVPTTAPTTAPTVAPTVAPTIAATLAPTEAPTAEPTAAAGTPTATPTTAATAAPTALPTETATASISAAASIEIVQPSDGDTVNPQSIQVSGNGAGLPKNNVVVQARLPDGTIVGQAQAIVNAPMEGAGAWSVVIAANVELGTEGYIYAFGLSPTEGSILAEDQIDVIYGVAPEASPTPTPTATAQPFLLIDEPEDGSIVDLGEVLVSGSGAAIPNNNVIVRALDSDGFIIAEEATTLSSSDGGEGSWEATLEIDVAPGMAGSIVAYAVDPTTGIVLTNDRVRVTFGEPPAPVTPELQIDQPTEGASVDSANGFAVSGTASGLFEGTVVVRLFNQLGQIIYQTVTTAGSDGLWSVAVRLLVANNTPATIYAFSPSPVDGSPLVEDQVSVTLLSACVPRTDWIAYTVEPGDTIFGIAQSSGVSMAVIIQGNCLTNPNVIEVGQIIYVPSLPVPGVVPEPPSVTITSPTADAALALDAPVAVSGSSSWSQPGLVWVRALDNMGMVLDEERVDIVEETDGETWTWQTELDLRRAAPGARGLLMAYVPSLQDGSIVAYTIVPVIYGGDQGLPYIVIQNPPPYLGQSLDSGIAVTGRARGVVQGTMIVQALDNAGNIVSQLPAVMEAATAAGESNWSVTLPVSWIGHGKIVASVFNNADGTNIALASVDLLFGFPANQATYVEITYPLPNTLLESSADLIAVVGYAGGLLGDTIYLSGLDAANRARFVIPVSVDVTTGRWSIVPSGNQPLREDGFFALYAAATEPTTGQIMAFDRIELRVQRPTVTGQIVYPDGIVPPPDATVSVRVIAMPANTSQQQEVLTEQTLVAGAQSPVPFALPYDPALVDASRLYLLEAQVHDAAGNLLFTSMQPIPVITQGAATEGLEVIVDPAS